MAFLQDFTAAQVYGFPNIIRLEDTSTGSDVAIVGRRVYLQKLDGSYLVPEGTSTDFIEWDILDATLLVDILTKDMVLTITVEWIDVSGDVLFTKAKVSLFTLFLKSFFYYLTQQQSANPNLIRDINYFNYKSKLWVYITSAINAVELASDTFNAQSSLDAGSLLVSNENKYF